ncbi:MAG TPA: nuclear transport factor 2 family protein [Longimicrobium sp.]|jgi:ketosteroid isomerase-like protein|nr:nuclear transport factor 2 family protein [Longimicrobium sp.]
MMAGIADLANRYYERYQAADREAIEALLAEDFTFTSPWDDHIDRATYFSHCFPHAGEFRFRFPLRIFVDGDEAMIVYETEGKQGGAFHNAELFRFAGGRIRSITVFFGFIPGALGAEGD